MQVQVNSGETQTGDLHIRPARAVGLKTTTAVTTITAKRKIIEPSLTLGWAALCRGPSGVAVRSRTARFLETAASTDRAQTAISSLIYMI
jgi:hypothetical protein